MPKRVLVVEDDRPTSQMIAAVLRRKAIDVELCTDTREALERFEQEHYPVVVLSLVRADPKGDADALIRLKERPEPPCVVLISAGSNAALEAMLSDLVRARLRKPFAIEALVEAVESCL